MDQNTVNSLAGAKSETQTLCEFLAGLRYEQIPLDVVARTEDFFLDWLGSGLAGKGSRPVLVLEQFAKAMGPATGPSEILTTRGRTSPFFAALINGAASHVVEQDDVHNGSVFHPAAVVFPAALAVAQAAERAAINAPMQGTAADLIKLAMISVHAWLKQANLRSRLVMQVHDELVLEVPEAELDIVRAGLPGLMGGVARLDVPLLVEIGAGANWEKAH